MPLGVAVVGAQCADFVAGSRRVAHVAIGCAQRQGQALAAAVFAGRFQFDAVIARRARAAGIVQPVPLHRVVAGLALTVSPVVLQSPVAGDQV